MMYPPLFRYAKSRAAGPKSKDLPPGVVFDFLGLIVVALLFNIDFVVGIYMRTSRTSV